MSAAEYALRLANGEPLDVLLHEVWVLGTDAGSDPACVSPFTGETGSE